MSPRARAFLTTPSMHQESSSSDKSLRSNLRKTFYRIFFRSTTRANDFLTKNALMTFLNSSADPWIMYQVQPVPSMMMSSVGFCLVVIFMLLLSGNTLYMMYQLPRVGCNSHAHYRLRVQEWANYDASSASASSTRLGLLRDGCMVSDICVHTTQQDGVLLSCDHQVSANGFYILHDNTFPKKFVLEASNDREKWSVQGASGRRFVSTGFLFAHWQPREDLEYTYTFQDSAYSSKVCQRLKHVEGCENAVLIDNSWRWPMILPIAVNLISITAMMFWVSLSFRNKNLQIMRFVMVIAMYLCAVTCLIFAILWCLLPDRMGLRWSQESLYAWNSFALYLVLGWTMQRLYDRYFLTTAIAFEVLFLTSAYVNLWYVYGNSVSSIQILSATMYFIIIAVTAGGIHANGARCLRNADRRFSSYRQKIRRTLQENDLLVNESDMQQIESKMIRLKRMSAPLQKRPSTADVATVELRISECSESSSIPPASLHCQAPPTITCMDQLFIQAEMLKPFLIMKVLQLAYRSGGLLKSVHGDWVAAALESDEFQESIRWTPLKSYSRIICKTFCSLEGVFSQLSDICRERIVFQDTKTLLQCLQSVLDDKELRVVSATNTMRDALISTSVYHVGVTLNLCIASAQTHSLGITRHVCELQLMLRELAELQDDKSHEDYKSYRDAFDCQRTRVFFNLRKTLSREFRWKRLLPPASPTQVHPDEQPPSEPPVTFLKESELWLEKFCRRRAQLPGNMVTSQLSDIHDAIAKASFSSCFFTATPVAAALSKSFFQFFFIQVGMMYLFHLGLIVYGYTFAGSMTYNLFRFSVKEYAGADLTAGNFQLSSFGLLRDGCKLASSAVMAQQSSNVIKIWMNASLEANGWYYSLPASTSPALIPIAFALEGSQDGNEWHLAGGSRVMTGEAGYTVLSSRANQRLEGRLENAYDYRPDTIWFVSWFFTYFIGFLMYWFCGAIAFLRMSGYVKYFLGTGYLLKSLFTLLAVPWLAVEGETGAVIDYILRGLCWAFLGGPVLFAESAIVYSTAIGGLLTVAVKLINVFVLQGDTRNLAFRLLLSSYFHFGLSLFMFGLLSILLRYSYLRKARRLIEQDRGQYAQIWERISNHDESRELLRRLQDMTQAYQAGKRIRHTIPVALEAAWSEIGFSPLHYRSRLVDSMATRLFGGVGSREPVACLDQLLAQAKGLDYMMRDCCKKWALACRGSFQLRDGTFLTWEQVVAQSREEEVSWAKIKGPLRIMEKTLRSYGQDPSYLCDVCRQSIVFESLGDLVQCVQTLMQDEASGLAGVLPDGDAV
eukprot:767561-Hanusia_phi.AAC.10